MKGSVVSNRVDGGWQPLPFPTCAGCGRGWVSCFHVNCCGSTEILVHPASRQSYCPDCRATWGLMDSVFHCLCGAVFSAKDVEEALSADALIRARLIEEMRKMSAEEEAIFKSASTSLMAWTRSAFYEIGRLSGRVFRALD